MIPSGDAPFNGIYPATLCPLRADYAIDEAALAGHVSAMADVPGHVGVLCNGHAGENFVLERAEKRRVVAVVREAIGARAIVVSGVNCESSLEAAEHARDAEAAGADTVMVFPPNAWALGQDDTMALNHHRAVIDAVDLPIMLFQASVNAGQTAYRPEVLARLAQLPRVVAIKDGSWEVARYEANRRLIKEAAPHVAVMGSGDEHLLTSYVVGSEGSLVSWASRASTSATPRPGSRPASRSLGGWRTTGSARPSAPCPKTRWRCFAPPCARPASCEGLGGLE